MIVCGSAIADRSVFSGAFLMDALQALTARAFSCAALIEHASGAAGRTGCWPYCILAGRALSGAALNECASGVAGRMTLSCAALIDCASGAAGRTTLSCTALIECASGAADRKGCRPQGHFHALP